MQPVTRISIACMQASKPPVQGKKRIDPDLLPTTFALALFDGNETAFDIVLDTFMQVGSTNWAAHMFTSIVRCRAAYAVLHPFEQIVRIAQASAAVFTWLAGSSFSLRTTSFAMYDGKGCTPQAQAAMTCRYCQSR